MADRPQVRRVAVCRYRFDPSVLSADVDASRAAFAPISKGPRRRRIAILSTTWQTVSLMAPQDHGYRAFITELHRRMRAAGSKASLTGGIGTVTYATAVTMVALLAIAMIGLLVRALMTFEFTGALFLVGMAALVRLARSAASSNATGRAATLRPASRRAAAIALFAIKRHEM